MTASLRASGRVPSRARKQRLMPFAHLFATPLMRRVEHLGPWTGVTRPALDASPEVVSAAQAARARRRRPGAPRTHRRTRIARGDLPRLLEAEGYVRTWRLPGRTFRHRRLRVVVLDKARAGPAPRRGPRPRPREVELTWRLLNSASPAARDELARFYRRGRWVEQHRHAQQRAGIDLPMAEEAP